MYLIGRNADMELDFCRRLNIETRRQQSDDPDKAWRLVKGEIDDGRPVMVWCDIAELPYLRVRLSNTRHDVVIIGYDDEQNTVFIVDNDREDVQEVPMAAFQRAHGSSGFPGPNRFATYPMRFPAQLPDLLTCAREAAASAARVLGGEDALLFDVSSLPEGSLVASGVEGVKAFADDIITWPYRLDPDDLTTAVRSIPVFVEKAGTGAVFSAGWRPASAVMSQRPPATNALPPPQKPASAALMPGVLWAKLPGPSPWTSRPSV